MLTTRRHLRDALSLFSLNKRKSFFSIFWMIITALTMMLLFLFQMNSKQISTNIENRARIRVSIQRSATHSQELSLKQQILATPNVKAVRYSSKKAELKSVIKENGSAFKADAGIGTPTLAVYYVEVNDVNHLADTTARLNKLQYVHEADGNISQVTATKQVLLILNAGILTLVIIFVLYTYHRLKKTAKDNLEINKQTIIAQLRVGATHRYIKMPYAYQAAFTGLFGSIGGIILLVPIYWFGYLLLNQKLDGILTLLSPYRSLPLVAGLTLLLLVIFSFWATYSSLHIKEKRQR